MGMKQQEYLQKLYANRFDPTQRKAKILLWKTLIKDFLQKYVDPHSVTLDIGGGYCEFINNIKSKDKYLIDLNPDAKLYADPDVSVLNLNVLELSDQEKIDTKFDIIFISNFFEHLANKEELIEILGFCFEILKPGGSLLVIQPNFAYSYREYYDFIDHQLPITHLSLKELLETIGYKIDVLLPKFLPFSTKGRPSSPLLLSLYLKIPIAWHFLGGQMFIKAVKSRL
ncbi:class I SAM-dependent methyltransferase [Crocosphaera sp. XPORK-15E]|uniref:class I SAM-dependent methyltransferase n=1 Tax=Crocosphaera sp. XPORK-15E TaxID=3110247 RepID=UPI002B1F6C37|nr:methyltransferase [Crocosphaera sp. XPORK-15E]MEA5536457.1 methyltransferase [Crocosphaera sp. XPORK-15E]